jgi:penicillin G amidase
VNRRRAARAAGIATGVVLIAALVVLVVLVVTFVRRPLPDRGGQLALPGLGAKVTVVRDDRGIPQIYASNPADLFRAQGYVHAQDRFFEMDLRRHITAGRLSELVGRNDDALLSDSVVRTLGWRRVAQQELATAQPATRNYLEAYAKGVNDYISKRSPSELSVSYPILGRANRLPAIEPWTPVDSLAWLKAMAWDLRGNYDEELQRARAADRIKDIDRINELFPAYPYREHAPIIPPGGAAAGSGDSADAPADQQSALVTDSNGLRRALGSDSAQRVLTNADTAIRALPTLLGHGDGVGSNAWVIGGSLTTSGLPLLANDPHLSVSQPGIWYQAGLHCSTVNAACPFDVAGFGFAGLPGVVIGHNATVSWGLTNLYPDVTDFYLERVTGNSAEKDGKQEPLQTRQETIQVAGHRPVTITVRSSSHGPLLSDVLDSVARAGQSAPVAGESDDRTTSYAVALDWTALTPGTAMDAIFGLNLATDFASFRTAALKLDAPAQNLVYADVDGHIGYQAPGRIPQRGPGRSGSPVPGDGTWPHPGWDSSYDWTGFVPVESLPWVEDPKQGYIVAANQAVSAPGTGQVQVTKDSDYGFRSQRINDQLAAAVQAGRKLSPGDMRSIQQDTHNGIAAVLVPMLLTIDVSDPFTKEAVELLRGWDYSQPVDSAAAAYFNVVWADILGIAFGDELPEGFRPDGGDRWFEVVQTLLDDPRNPWWDDRKTPDVVESRDEVLRRSLSQARLQLTSSLGKDPGRWQWGRLHRLRLEQTPLGLAGSPSVIRSLVNSGPFDAPGGSSIVNAFSWDASSGSFDVTAAPSMRMIVDLSDLDSSRWVNQTGISGHPWDSHYSDQTQAWLKGEDYAWRFSADAVREAAGDTLEITPAG